MLAICKGIKRLYHSGREIQILGPLLNRRACNTVGRVKGAIMYKDTCEENWIYLDEIEEKLECCGGGEECKCLGTQK